MILREKAGMVLLILGAFLLVLQQWLLALLFVIIGAVVFFAGRYSHCYRCKATIDRGKTRKCTTCNWNICPRCGACGCGYKGGGYIYRGGFKF